MKFVWPPEYEAELRREGYEAGYAAMYAVARQALQAYSTLVFQFVKVHDETTDQRLLGPIPALEDPNLGVYLERVTDQALFAYFMAEEYKQRIAAQAAELLAKDQTIAGLTSENQQAQRQLDHGRSQAAFASEAKLKETLEENGQLQTRLAVLEEIVTVAQNELDRKGNNSGQQLG